MWDASMAEHMDDARGLARRIAAAQPGRVASIAAMHEDGAAPASPTTPTTYACNAYKVVRHFHYHLPLAAICG